MITISTEDYSTEQLKELAYFLAIVEDQILKRHSCGYDEFCDRICDSYVICNDLFKTCQYLYKKIKEREA